MIRQLIVMFLLILAPIGFAQNRQKMTNKSEFEKKLQAVSEKTQSVESEFRQEKFMSVFAEKIISSGKFYYRKPNNISLQYQKPMSYNITIANEKLQTISGKNKTTVNLGSNKMMAQMRGLIEASMVGNISALSKDYRLEYFQSDADYFIKITPISKSIQAYVKEIEITFDRQTMGVIQLRMTENNNDYTDYFFFNQKYNTLKNNEKFTIR